MECRYTTLHSSHQPSRNDGQFKLRWHIGIVSAHPESHLYRRANLLGCLEHGVCTAPSLATRLSVLPQEVDQASIVLSRTFAGWMPWLEIRRQSGKGESRPWSQPAKLSISSWLGNIRLREHEPHLTMRRLLAAPGKGEPFWRLKGEHWPCSGMLRGHCYSYEGRGGCLRITESFCARRTVPERW